MTTSPGGPRLLDSGPLPYLLSVPSAPEPASALRPVLFFLHGYDEAAPLEIHRALTRHGPLRPGNPPRVLREFIVVAPQLPAPGGDVWHRYAAAVERIVRNVQREHHGDPERTFLTGFSFGGNGVFDLAPVQRRLWAALWAVDPTRVPSRDPDLPVWLSSGQVSRRGEAAFRRALDLAPPGDPPVGDRILLDRGADHVGTAMRAYADDRIYTWLLGRNLPEAP